MQLTNFHRPCPAQLLRPEPVCWQYLLSEHQLKKPKTQKR